MFCFRKMYFSATFWNCFSCSRSSPSSSQSARSGLTCHKVFTGYWSCSFSSPLYYSTPGQSCSSICLCFASSLPPPPHWAIASFTQAVSRVLQVHVMSNRQTYYSLFIKTITLWDCCGDSTLTTAPPHWSLPPPRCSLDSTFIHYLSLIVGFRYIIEKGGWQ